jgi:hypothetical protein
MSEDFLDELGEEFRAGYNPPPATPREAIWGALQARRSLRAAYNPPPPTPVERIWAAHANRFPQPLQSRSPSSMSC